MLQNAHPLLNPSLLSRIGVRVDDPAYHTRPSDGNPHSYNLEQKGEMGHRPFSGLENSRGQEFLPQAPRPTIITDRAGRHHQAKQHVPARGSSFMEVDCSHVPATLRTTAFPPGTVTQGWNNHAYGVSATVSVSGSPGSDIKAMSIDDGSLDSRPSRKTSSKMSIDPSPLTGTRRKASSGMSVDPSPSPNIYQSTQHRTSSRMSVDAHPARSPDRMLLDKFHHDYHTQNIPQQTRTYTPLTARPTASPTRGCPQSALMYYSPREHTLAASVALPTSFPIVVSQKRPLSYDTRSPRHCGETKSIPLSQPPSSFPQYIQGKEKHKVIVPTTSTPPFPCISQAPTSAPMLPLHLPDSAPVAPPKTVSPKHKTPASRQGSRSPSTKREVIHSPTSRGRVRARESSSRDEVIHKRHCVRQDSRPIALLAIDPHSVSGPSLQPAQSLSPIDDGWLPPMEQQLETARQSQLKDKFRKFKAIIGGAVNGIKQAIVPYNKAHRNHKAARMRSASQPFAGVPDYLRSAEPPKHTSASRYHKRPSFDIGKGIDSIAETWTNLSLCDSPTSLNGDDGAVHGEAPQLSLSLPRINEPPKSSHRSPPPRRAGSVIQTQSDDEVEIYTGTAGNLAAPTFRRHRTADAFDARGMDVPRHPNNSSPRRK
ncbi:hypothetical protein AZE42_02560 [Rhizopogon vesiculosus]|uniref:Uncharacterized protein n=1 Tax=Rhizopogon vesiculosus TaxID=180088 RepID=A0A1J8QBF1_9AGAM|nr:hypothetical protein AZE42_02560 [Rhizopogon vesiculosus]